MDENKVKKNNSSGAGSMDEQDLACFSHSQVSHELLMIFCALNFSNVNRTKNIQAH